NGEKKMALPTRQLGKDGPQVTTLGWGAMGISGGFLFYVDFFSLLLMKKKQFSTAPLAQTQNGSTSLTKCITAAASTGIRQRDTRIARN
ncbi:MAG: hypothetical protein Q9191_008354, partial [Dirinaria sp. TL-2023a]